MLREMFRLTRSFLQASTRQALVSLEMASKSPTASEVYEVYDRAHFKLRKTARPKIIIGLEGSLRAFWAMVTLQVFDLGDESPLADSGAKIASMATNIALVSALLFTCAVPTMFDWSASAESNAYIITNPRSFGEFVFVLFSASAVAFGSSLLGCVCQLVYVKNMDNEHAVRYWVRISRFELVMPVQHLVLGVLSYVGALFFWFIIVCFELSAVESDCDDEVTRCGKYVAAFVFIHLAAGALFLHFVYVTVRMTAKMFLAHAKFVLGGDSKDWFLEMGTKELWAELQNYIDQFGCNISAQGFKEFLIQQAAGTHGALSSVTDLLAEKVYAHWMAQLLKSEQHAIDSLAQTVCAKYND